MGSEVSSPAIQSDDQNTSTTMQRTTSGRRDSYVLSNHTISLLTLHTLVVSDSSESSQPASQAAGEDERVPAGPGNELDDDEYGLNEDLELLLDETQPVLSLQTAEDVDLEMDADLQVHVDIPDEGDETDVSEGDGVDYFN